MNEPTVEIRYRRLPDRLDRYRQTVLETTDGYVVTFLASASLSRPVLAGDRIILEPGAPVIWFTYPGRWYDIGLFHLADGTFTGTYANVLTPVVMSSDGWDTTDLCLDVWSGADGQVALLDEDEFEAAMQNGWIGPAEALQARRTADALLADARRGLWPPTHVVEWTISRVRARL